MLHGVRNSDCLAIFAGPTKYISRVNYLNALNINSRCMPIDTSNTRTSLYLAVAESISASISIPSDLLLSSLSGHRDRRLHAQEDNKQSGPKQPAISSQDDQDDSSKSDGIDIEVGMLVSAMIHVQADAPACDVCGAITVRNGTCYKCLNCGNSMGCS